MANFLEEHTDVADTINGKSRKDLDKILKDLKFPAYKGAFIRSVKQSTKSKSELSEVLPLVQKINKRQYQNVSEVYDTINGKVREEWDKILMKAGVEEELIRKMLSNSTIINVLLGKDGGRAVNSDTVRKLASL